MVSGKKFLAGLAAGAAVGAVASLLLAPKSGEETRKLLWERAANLQATAGGRFDNLFSKGRRQG